MCYASEISIGKSCCIYDLYFLCNLLPVSEGVGCVGRGTGLFAHRVIKVCLFWLVVKQALGGVEGVISERELWEAAKLCVYCSCLGVGMVWIVAALCPWFYPLVPL